MLIMYLKNLQILDQFIPVYFGSKTYLYSDKNNSMFLSLDVQYLISLCLNCSVLSGVTVFRQITISNICKFLCRNS